MGKTRNTGKLATQIQFDNSNNLVIGTSASSSFNTSGSVNAIGGITGSIFGIGNPTSFSASISSNLVSIQSVTASNIARLSNLETKSSSVDISVSSINTFTSSNANTSLNLLTGSLATTGSNTFKGTQIVSASMYVTGDFVVFGSSSIQYISASSVSIGTNIVQLNTANPAVRYAGLSVQDSGSAQGVTGSMLWDSVCNRWIYSNPSGVGYSGGVIMSGPRAATFGTETTLTCNYIAKSGGGDHLYDSCIIDDGTTTCIKNNLVTTGTACFASSVTSSTLQINSTTYVPLKINTTYGQVGLEFQLNGIGFGGIGSATNFTGAYSCSSTDIGIGTNGSSTSNIIFATGTGFERRMIINSCGYIGIGSDPLTSTAAALQIEQAQSNIVAIRRANCSNTGNSRVLFQAYNASGTIQNTGIVEAGLDSSATNGYIGFYAGTATMNMKITSIGNVGIGTTCPDSKLHICNSVAGNTDNFLIIVQNCCTVSGARAGIAFSNNSQTPTAGGLSGAAIQTSNNGVDGAGNLLFSTLISGASCERMRITSGGLIGMNQPSPTYRLEICSPSSDCVLGLMSANGVNIDMVGYGVSLTYPQARVQMNDDGFYGGNLSFFTKPNGASGNGLTERMRITSCGKVGIGACSPKWLLEICANNACGGAGQYPALAINNVCVTGYAGIYFYRGLDQMGGLEISNSTCNILINSQNGALNLQTAGTNRLTLNNVGGFGTQLCNFCLTGTYQTLVTVENGSYGLLMLSSCIGGGTYALYNIFNNAGTTTANLIQGNNIPTCIVGNAVQVKSTNGATYCDVRSSYIRFY